MGGLRRRGPRCTRLARRAATRLTEALGRLQGGRTGLGGGVHRWWGASVADRVCGEALQRGEMKGEVRHTVNRVHGAWGGGSPRKGLTTAFPHDSSEAGGSPTPTMDEMQRGEHRGCRATLWQRRKAGGEKILGSAVIGAF
jgi:hypothetical protein